MSVKNAPNKTEDLKDNVLEKSLDVIEEMDDEGEDNLNNEELVNFVKETVQVEENEASEIVNEPEDLNEVVPEQGEKEQTEDKKVEPAEEYTRPVEEARKETKISSSGTKARKGRSSVSSKVNLGTDLMPEAYHEQSKKIFTPVEDWMGIRTAIAAKLLVRSEVVAVDDNEEKIYVEVGNIRGTIPLSESGYTKETRSLVWLVGRTICFVIKAADEKNGFFIASRAEGLLALAEAVRNQLKVGEIRTGVVSRLEQWGAWVELGGVYGRLSRRELMHHFVNNIADVIQPGDLIDVKITAITDTGRVRVSLKQALPNPWEKVASKYKVGMISKGKITGVLPNLVFIQFEPGVDAVAPFPKFPIRVDQMVSAKIHNIDIGKQRMSAAIWRTIS